MFENTNIEVVPLFFELDGNFPNHEANPSVKWIRLRRIGLIKVIDDREQYYFNVKIGYIL